MALINPQEAYVRAHVLQNGRQGSSRIGSENFPFMFKRYWTNAPGGLTDARALQVDGLKTFPQTLKREVAAIIWKIFCFGTMDLYPDDMPTETLLHFRQWVSKSWIKSGLHAALASPLTSIEPSVSVFRAPSMAAVLNALEHKQLVLHLLPAVADNAQDVIAMLAQAALPDELLWLTRRTTSWKRPGTPVFSGATQIKMMPTEQHPLMWSTLNQCIVAGITTVAIVLRPSRASRHFVAGITACEYDLLRWAMPEGSTMMDNVPKATEDMARWIKTHVGIGRDKPEWLARVARVSAADLGIPASCNYEVAREAVHLHEFLAAPQVDAAMRTTETYSSNSIAAVNERVAIQTALTGQPPSKRRRTEDSL